MKMNNEIIQAFLNDHDIENCKAFPLLNNYKTPEGRIDGAIKKGKMWLWSCYLN